MCEPTLIIAGIMAITSTVMSVEQAKAQAEGIEEANERAQQGIREQAMFNRAVSVAKAIEGRDKSVVETVELQKEGLRAAGRVRVMNLTGPSGRRVAGGVQARILRQRQLAGFTRTSKEQQAGLEIMGGAVNSRNQQRNLARGVSPAFAIAGTVVSGLASVGGAAYSSGLFDPKISSSALSGLDGIDYDFSETSLMGGFQP